MDNYILDDQLNPVPVSFDDDRCRIRNKEDWNEKRRIAITKFTTGESVSTVFLGLDHSHTEGGPPILFETLAFGKHGNDGTMIRYATFDEAVAGHKETVDSFIFGGGPEARGITEEYIRERPPEPPRKLEYYKESNNSILRKKLIKRIRL